MPCASAPHAAEVPLPLLGRFRVPPDPHTLPPTVLASHVQDRILERAGTLLAAFAHHAQLGALTGTEYANHADALRRAITDNITSPARAQRSWALVRDANASRHRNGAGVVDRPT